jgi:hypothetical protein
MLIEAHPKHGPDIDAGPFESGDGGTVIVGISGLTKVDRDIREPHTQQLIPLSYPRVELGTWRDICGSCAASAHCLLPSS